MRVTAAIEIAAVHSVMHASAPVHPASAAMHATAAVHPAPTAMHAAPAMARAAAAAPAADLNDRTVVQLSGGAPRAVQFDGLRLRRCEAQQRCDRDPSADQSESFHGVPPRPAR
jgi:hypothetical protein